jgi:hypothetical protein
LGERACFYLHLLISMELFDVQLGLTPSCLSSLVHGINHFFIIALVY